MRLLLAFFLFLAKLMKPDMNETIADIRYQRITIAFAALQKVLDIVNPTR